MKSMLVKLTAPMVLGAVVLSAGVIVYAVINGCTIEVKSPFFGDWKITPPGANA